MTTGKLISSIIEVKSVSWITLGNSEKGGAYPIFLFVEPAHEWEDTTQYAGDNT